jgi:diguanylate cyclase (GGDEF)-like protein
MTVRSLVTVRLSKAPPSSRLPLPGDDDDPELAPLRVLVGEPDVSTSEWLTRVLRGRGYVVDVVRTEAEILHEVDHASYDVVLVAWSLPGATGLNVLRQVRARYAMPDLPVVLISPIGDAANVVKAFDRGANDFLCKPLDADITRVRVHNLVALRRARLALRQQAMVDALTGVFNRRYMMQQLGAQVASALRYGRRLAFCLCDVDHFKGVNDTHGHRMGDEALRVFASILRGRLRQADIVGRFGGDELCLVFPETGASEAMVAVESARAIVADRTITLSRGSVTCHITASFGVAEIDLECVDANALIARADEALYLAKEAGRNRAVAWVPSALAFASSA